MNICLLNAKKEEERKLNINHWIRQLMSSLPLESTDIILERLAALFEIDFDIFLLTELKFWFFM